MSEIVEVVVEKDEKGKQVLTDKNVAKKLYELIVDSFPEEELELIKRCPICRKKTASKEHIYTITRHMVEILVEMNRIITVDPGKHGFVFIREEPRSIRKGEEQYSMTIGGRQTHKMTWLGLITPIDHDLNPVDPEDRISRLRSAYKITDKGHALLRGEAISPASVHRKNGGTIVTEDDKTASVSRDSVKDLSYNDYIEMCKRAEIKYPALPVAVGAGDAK
jgi:hypothetical protein